jgi:hypothetical protein
MSTPYTWRTTARVVARDSDWMEVRLPGGWPPVRVRTGAGSQWLHDAPVGTFVICTAQLTTDDTVVVTDWHWALPIGLDPHRFNIDDFDVIPDAKLQLIDGIVFGDVASRDAVLGALLWHAGLADVVRMAPRDLWVQALARVSEG